MNKIKLFENCIITRGHTRSVILDVLRRDYYFIPNSLADAFDDRHMIDLGRLAALDAPVAEEYGRLLIDNELGFWCDDALSACFPVIDVASWDYPAVISNAVLEINAADFDSRLGLLTYINSKLLTRYFEIHIAGGVSSRQLTAVLQAMDKLDLYSYELIFSPADDLTASAAVQLLSGHFKISRSVIYSAGENRIVERPNGWGNIFLTRDAFSYNQCGIVDPSYFLIDSSHVYESMLYNSCLNKKLFIGADLTVKNCPNTNEPHTLKTVEDLLELVSSEHFTKLWHIKKDDVTGCRVCEFRHVCTDCRAFTVTGSGDYGKPLKCRYDPYTGIWDNSGIRKKQEAATI